MKLVDCYVQSACVVRAQHVSSAFGATPSQLKTSLETHGYTDVVVQSNLESWLIVTSDDPEGLTQLLGFIQGWFARAVQA